MRLIDADAIIAEQREIMEKMYCSTIPELKKHMSIDDDLPIYIQCMELFSREKQFYHGLRGILENAPTVDAVRVTRCKDCKYSSYDSKPDGAMVCLRTKDGFWRKETDFCSYGTPKNDGGET